MGDSVRIREPRHCGFKWYQAKTGAVLATGARFSIKNRVNPFMGYGARVSSGDRDTKTPGREITVSGISIWRSSAMKTSGSSHPTGGFIRSGVSYTSRTVVIPRQI